MCCGKEKKKNSTKIPEYFLTHFTRRDDGNMRMVSPSASVRPAEDSERERHQDKGTKRERESHHVKIGADFDSSGQVPHYAIPIMPG